VSAGESDRLLASLAPALALAPVGPLGVAVSGGGDSTALLLLVSAWARAEGRQVAAVTVDHKLRRESAAEAETVVRLAAGLGLPHVTLPWLGWDGHGNLQDHARAARRRLIADWARREGIGAVALGHTLDDQAETFLMRLARGSGVDGLAAMQRLTEAEGVLWIRPMLSLRRAELREFLRLADVGWCEDPSNEDPAFDRVRARRALGLLADLGLGAERLAETAGRMSHAREALEQATRALARTALRPGPAGDLALNPRPLVDAPRELRLRLVAAGLMWVSGAAYRPRFAALGELLAAIEAARLGGGVTLHGCVVRSTAQGWIAIRREPARVAAPVPADLRRWDRRWKLAEPAPQAGLRIGALGPGGLDRLPEWRTTGLAREALITTPALWRGTELVAAPLAGLGPEEMFQRISANPPPWSAAVLR
jgi:tRNA(Ile)-lysidine synthase